MKKTILAAAAALCTAAATAQPVPRIEPEINAHYTERLLGFMQEAPVAPHHIVMLGNSLTEGGDWPTLLHNPLVRNRGINGDMSTGIIGRLSQILPGKPRAIFLMIGINDLSQNISTRHLLMHYRQIAEEIHSHSPQTRLYIQSMLPIREATGRWTRLKGKSPQIAEVNRELRLLAAEFGDTFIDLYPLFTEPGTDVLRQELTTDGLHLTARGYEIWAGVVAKHLSALAREE